MATYKGMPTPLTLNELSAIDGSLTEEERQLRASVRRLVAARYAPEPQLCSKTKSFPATSSTNSLASDCWAPVSKDTAARGWVRSPTE